MAVSDQQVRKLMDELSKHGEVGRGALRAGMDRKTARKYAKSKKLPSECRKIRTYRTRPDPLSEDWTEVVQMLQGAPELEAKALFEHLLETKPERYHPGQVRTFQRRVQMWRAQEGPAKEVFFEQRHRPGEAAQTDFTWGTELEITIGGEAFDHLLCHVVLPYSNWEWATVCRSESLMALKRGVQDALFQLGRVPELHQTDNSTAATHNLPSGKREFNAAYVAIMEHLGMTPRTIAIGKKHQNGDVEAANGALKRRLKQHLLLRASRDFDSVEAYERWVQTVVEKANRLREKRLHEELEVMKPLEVQRLPEFIEERVRVSAGSSIRIKLNTYSVPSRLIDEEVRVRLYDDRLEVYHGGRQQLVTERLLGSNGHRIDYRHVVGSLVRKAGAFRRYRYREDLFPSLAFRRAYDSLCDAKTEWQADIEYVRILEFAGMNVEADVEVALDLLHGAGALPTAERVKELVSPRAVEVPDLAAFVVDLSSYDGLLESREEVA